MIPMAIRSVGLEKKLQAVMEQAVENCDVAGVNQLVEKEGRRSASARREWQTGRGNVRWTGILFSGFIPRRNR